MSPANKKAKKLSTPKITRIKVTGDGEVVVVKPRYNENIRKLTIETGKADVHIFLSKEDRLKLIEALS